MLQRLVALIILILISPLLLCVSLIILLSDGFPIIFKQKKFGKDNIIFDLYKFRTMKKNTPNIPTELFKNSDEFLIQFGNIIRKFSLDELPQLINILKGEMNFIGPRPCMAENEDILNELREKKGINTIKPGITGWAQVNGRDLNSFEKKTELDYYYFKNRSLYINCLIIIKTLYVVLLSKDIKH